MQWFGGNESNDVEEGSSSGGRSLFFAEGCDINQAIHLQTANWTTDLTNNFTLFN